MTKRKIKNEIPERVSWRVIDAWKAVPPCNNSKDPYCHVDCPYYLDCNTENDEEFERI